MCGDDSQWNNIKALQGSQWKGRFSGCAWRRSRKRKISRAAHLKVVGTSEDRTPVAKPRLAPEADTVCGAVALVTSSLPPPGGSASKAADGIVSCPALEGAWQ